MPVAHITTKGHRDVPGWAASGDNVIGALLTESGTVESWPHFSLYTALGKVGLTLRPDSKVELALMAGVWVSQTQGHEYRRADPGTLLRMGIIDTEEMSPVSCHVWQLKTLPTES